MRFLAKTCRCGADLENAEVEDEKVQWRGEGEDAEPYAECPAGCGRTYLLTDEEPAEPEDEPGDEPAGDEPGSGDDEPGGGDDEPSGDGPPGGDDD